MSEFADRTYDENVKTPDYLKLLAQVDVSTAELEEQGLDPEDPRAISLYQNAKSAIETVFRGNASNSVGLLAQYKLARLANHIALTTGDPRGFEESQRILKEMIAEGNTTVFDNSEPVSLKEYMAQLDIFKKGTAGMLPVTNTSLYDKVFGSKDLLKTPLPSK